MCSNDLIETIKSPNGKYEIRTYLRNCGATCDFEVSANLCDNNDKCKKIYYAYHEQDSFVYWIDDENVFINFKTLNIFKDKYNCYNCNDSQFRLYSNLTSKYIYLIDKEHEYKLTNKEVYYMKEYGKSTFNFNKNNIYNEYDLVMKLVDLKKGKVVEYFVKIDENKMYIINEDKMSELNRTDFEYMKKILKVNDLYKFD